MKKTLTRPIRKDLMTCHWTGRMLGKIGQRLDCAGVDIQERNFYGASHQIFLAKLDLKEASWAIGKNTAGRLIKLLDTPHQALQDAQAMIHQGKQGRVSRSRLYPAQKALMKVMERASKKCQ